jgi:methionine sulfoxide reductase heme-binding subunit
LGDLPPAVSVSLSVLSTLIARASLLIQFHRLTGLYTFFFATLHLLIYSFIYSGYDFIAVFAGFHTGHPGVLLAEWNAVVPGIFGDFRKRPFLDVGFFAWALLLLSALTTGGLLPQTLDGKKRRYLFDCLIYLVTIASVIHWWYFEVRSVPTAGGRCIDVFRAAAISNAAEKE